MNKRLTLILFIGSLLIYAGMHSIDVFLFHPPTEAKSEKKDDGIMPEIKLFAKALNVILEGYVDPVGQRQMFYEAVRGMTEALDQYTIFLDPDKFEAIQIHIEGEYAGVGARLALLDGFPAIYEIEEGSAAHEAGLEVKDKIIKVDNRDTFGLTVEEVAKMLRGEAGTEVFLRIQRDISDQVFDVTLTRKIIQLPAVRDVRMVGRALGYLRISNWQEHTVEQFDAAFQDLRDQGMEALIIDLRNNSGGILPSAVAIAERFLKKGEKIVKVDSKVGVQKREYVSSGEYYAGDMKVVILIDNESASASEIFSAAMRENGHAVLVGIQSFGKASVQSVVPLDERSGMKITTARYLTPEGNRIDGVGIAPDISVEKDAESGGVNDAQIVAAVSLLKSYM